MAYYVLGIVIVALLFDFINGFHDSANSIATIVGTRVLTPLAAVIWAAIFNFLALFYTGTGLAKAIGAGYIDISIVDANVIMASLMGAIIWNIITWWFGIPSSSSHALIGGYAGAAVAKAGWSALLWGPKWIETLSGIILSPASGMMAGFLLMTFVCIAFKNVSYQGSKSFFRIAQLTSSAMLSLAHGGNDAQKTMGIIVALLVATQTSFVGQTGWEQHLYVKDMSVIPIWVELSAYTMISMGTLFGGWRIVHTMGTRITKLRPVGGFCAETGGALVIMFATHFKIPVSTTHTITGAIVGVGATTRLSAVRWGLAGRIVWAWVITIPAALLLAALSYKSLALLVTL
ncbi:inorganic phosphate transporter [Gemmatimonas sp.]|uniref:inorganic phosphate transporter n=1 Tax=Gemmatimonas sp. TaxID=1962908 RepID=UPI00286DB92E|nr:inorganic phosphate transporter [Gemmatimonas sp.]